MRIAIATDAWSPQVNGVVTTLGQTRDHLVKEGHEVFMVTPEGRRTFPCPTYPEIRLTLFQGRAIARELDAFEPDCVHIATEGTIGLSVTSPPDVQSDKGRYSTNIVTIFKGENASRAIFFSDRQKNPA